MEQDKLGHLLVGAIVGAGVTLIFADPVMGAAAGIALGAAKELYDARHPDRHTVEFADFLATTIGAVFGAAVGAAFLFDPITNSIG